MPIESRAVLLSYIESELSDTLFANQMSIVLNALSDELVSYNVEQHTSYSDSRNDFLEAFLLEHKKLDTAMKYVCINDQDIKYSYNKYV